jgi:probable phosphoglycerate mutase
MLHDAQRATRVFFVRHGRAHRFTHGADAGLTELGVRQAQATAQFLQAQAIDAVYTSPTRRSAETGAIIAHALGYAPRAEPRLRAEYDPQAGLALPEFLAMWERANTERDWQPPVGDSARACGARMAAFMADCHAHHPNHGVVAVSHGGAIADLLLSLFSPAELAAVNPALAANPYDGTLLRECSVTLITTDARGPVLRHVALWDHTTNA